MNRFVLSLVLLCVGCSFEEYHYHYPESPEIEVDLPEDHIDLPPPISEDDMRNFINNTSFGTTIEMPIVQANAPTPGNQVFIPRVPQQILNVDLSSIFLGEKIDSEIIRVPANWVITVKVDVTPQQDGNLTVVEAPVKCVMEFGSGGSQTQIEFNPMRSSQLVVPATNVRVWAEWDQDVTLNTMNPAFIPKNVKVSAFLQRSPFVQNQAFKAFNIGSQNGFPFEPLAAIPAFAKSWNVSATDTFLQAGGTLSFFPSGQWSGSEIAYLRSNGALPVQVSPSYAFRWTNPAEPLNQRAFLYFNL